MLLLSAIETTVMLSARLPVIAVILIRITPGKTSGEFMGENPESQAKFSTWKKKAILSLYQGRNVRHKGSQVTIIRKSNNYLKVKVLIRNINNIQRRLLTNPDWRRNGSAVECRTLDRKDPVTNPLHIGAVDGDSLWRCYARQNTILV